MVGFNDLIYRLQAVGLYDAILPFFLVFVIVFAVLQKSNVLEDRRYNVVVSMIMGLLVVVPHVLGLYPAGADVVTIINTALPNVAVILVALVAVFLIIGLFGAKTAWVGSITGWVSIIALGLIVFIFGRAAGWFTYMPNWLGWLDNPDTQALLVIVGVFALVVHFITKEPKDPSAPGVTDALGKFGEEVGKLTGSGK